MTFSRDSLLDVKFYNIGLKGELINLDGSTVKGDLDLTLIYKKPEFIEKEAPFIEPPVIIECQAPVERELNRIIPNINEAEGEYLQEVIKYLT